MNERSFKAKLRRLLKPHCYIQSMSSLATNGTPDLWLSSVSDMWLEVKWDDKTVGPIKKPKLTPIQHKWIQERRAENRRVWILVGTSPNEGVLFTEEWNTARLPLADIVNLILGRLICPE